MGIDAQAKANDELAASNADIAREKARRLAATQRAQLAGSGVDLDVRMREMQKALEELNSLCR